MWSVLRGLEPKKQSILTVIKPTKRYTIVTSDSNTSYKQVYDINCVVSYVISVWSEEL